MSWKPRSCLARDYRLDPPWCSGSPRSGWGRAGCWRGSTGSPPRCCREASRSTPPARSGWGCTGHRAQTRQELCVWSRILDSRKCSWSIFTKFISLSESSLSNLHLSGHWGFSDFNLWQEVIYLFITSAEKLEAAICPNLSFPYLASLGLSGANLA